jgi:hypothetical protein
MSETTITQPTARTYSVEDLVELVLKGRIRVPHFQRRLRWQWEDVRRLFDSILRGYPIGSVLLWSRAAPKAMLELGALKIDAPRLDEALWVVDGQQRLTSLANALSDEGSKDPRFALTYDLQEKKLTRAGSDEVLRLPLPILFDLQRLLKWFAAHPEAAEHLDEATRVAKAIRQYVAPAYVVRQDDEAVLRDIFDRMNNYGKRLSRAEVFSALHSGQEPGDRPRNLSDIAEHLEARFGFGALDDDTVLRALLARRGPDVTRDIRLEFEVERVSREFPGETAEQANLGAEHALEHAVHFLQDDAHVPHFGFLPYRYLLVVLARFFAQHPAPVSRNRDLLRRWFWRAAMVGPSVARGSYTSAMRTLAACVDAGDESSSIERMLDAVSKTKLSFSFPRRFMSTMAEARFVLCALWELGPRSPASGAVYERATLSEVLSGRDTASAALELCFPRASARRSEAGNRIFLIGDDAIGAPGELFADRPVYLQLASWDEILASHALDSELARLLREGDAEAFIERRNSLLDEITQRFLERMTEAAFEDTPPLEDLDLDGGAGDDAHA